MKGGGGVLILPKDGGEWLNALLRNFRSATYHKQADFNETAAK
jgi:hypothetical protein